LGIVQRLKTWRLLSVALLAAIFLSTLFATLWIQRAFRTSSGPARWETAIARIVRHFAIPRTERQRMDPLAPSAENLQTGREEFLAHCSNCHGVDGSGRTPMGSHLYPRVPDLRAAPTQDLSDGEIHYIIENGVPLTGMPAWKNPQPESADRLWKLVLYIRTLNPLTPEVEARETNAAAQARYVGSQACAKCHGSIYQRWKKTPMANVVRDPREHPDAIPPDLATNSVFKFSPGQVAFVYGSMWKQRYFTKVGDDYFPLPVEWDIARHVWLPYFVAVGQDWWVPYYPPDNMKRPTGPLCDGCHSVGYDIRTKQVAEWNVGCERCHGPGSAHAAHPSVDNILNPARKNYVDASDTCIQCHSQGRPLNNPIEGKYYDWPVGYRVGLKLANFWKLEDHVLGKTDFYYFADGTAHKNRMQGNDFVQSLMYRRGISCFDCHDAHGTSNYAQLREPVEKLCLECHGPTSPNGPRTASIEQHTHHKEGTPGGRCVDCHMPAIETEGVPGSYVHAHTFRFISPAATDKYGIPNPCTSCHVNKPTSWATSILQGWSERSPWRLQ
jgi:predicted CXXCH cytochrome family protein